MQFLEPTVLANVPTGHGSHEACPFSSWNDPSGQTLRVHAHLGGHFTWIREIYSTPYPWEGCISHESKQ